jgi:hypothetical protein
MAQLSTGELKGMALETFGKVLTDAQAEAYRGRLPVMVAAANLLAEWQGRLGEAEPASVYLGPGEGEEV